MESDSSNSLNPRKKPGQRRSAATVAAIIEAAARVLETAGLEAYNTNAIAERAGVSIGSLYQYFPTKDAVTRALVQREAAILMEDISDIPALQSGRVGLERFIRAAVAHQLRRPVLARLVDIEEARLPPDPEVEVKSRRVTEIFSKCLCGADLPDTARAPEAAGDLLAIIRGIVDTAGRQGELDHVALIRRVNRAVFGYLEWQVDARS
jgi:AcrR family transcriptional regulator